jgi:hypothetical protein
MKFGDILDKITLGATKKQTIDYDIDVKGDKYSLVLKYNLPKNWWTTAIKYMNRGLVHKIELKDEWHADQRFSGMIMGKVKSNLDKVVEQVRKDIPTFKIMSMNVDDMAFKLNGEIVNATISLSGVCYA